MTGFTIVSTNTLPDGNSILLASEAVSGGTIYSVVTSRAGVNDNVSVVYVPTGATSPARNLSLTNAKGDTGVPLTAAAGTPAGAMGIARTAGTSLQLTGETTNSNAKTNVALWEINLPDSYITGASIPVTVNAIVTGAGTLTALSTTIAVAAYTDALGVETALAVTAANTFGKTASVLTYTITGMGLTPGARIAIELTMVVTSASGANTGWINSVSYQA